MKVEAREAAAIISEILDSTGIGLREATSYLAGPWLHDGYAWYRLSTTSPKYERSSTQSPVASVSKYPSDGVFKWSIPKTYRLNYLSGTAATLDEAQAEVDKVLLAGGFIFLKKL